MHSHFLPYARQSIQEADVQAVSEALRGEIITRGNYVTQFEQAIANYCGVRYAVAFNNGTTALMAAYFAAGLSPFDRILTTPNTFIATVGAAVQAGVTPHFIDIDRSTGNLNLSLIKSHLNFRSTRGKLIILPVHFAGIAIDMKELSTLLYPYPDTIVIEDAAHAIGSSYPTGEKVGSCAWSQLTIFSFHPAKTITTGEGGMVTTNDPDLYHRLQLYRNNGIEREAPYLKKEAKPGYYEVQAITGNFNFTDFQAALGLSQLQRLDQFIDKRRRLLHIYRKLLGNVPNLRLLSDQQDAITAFHLCVVQIDFAKHKTTREVVMQKLHEKGIGTQVHYIPLYYHPVLSHLHEKGILACPEMEIYYKEALSFPLYYDLKESEVERVCAELKRLLKV